MALNMVSAFENDPPEIDFIWPGFRAGSVGSLIGPGGAGKSFWALQAAMAVACGAEGDLVGVKPRHTGKVVYISCEDPEIILIHRVHAIGKFLSPLAREIIAENMLIEPIMGRRFNIMNDYDLAWLIDYSKDARLIVLDTLSRIHTLDENDNSHMANVVNALECVTTQTGAAVLFLHHVNKSSVRDGQADQQQAARGASVLTYNARWTGFISRMTEEESKRLSDQSFSRRPIGSEGKRFFVRFGVSKHNYGIDLPECWYERKEGGVLIPVKLYEASSGKRGSKDDREKV